MSKELMRTVKRSLEGGEERKGSSPHTPSARRKGSAGEDMETGYGTLSFRAQANALQYGKHGVETFTTEKPRSYKPESFIRAVLK